MLLGHEGDDRVLALKLGLELVNGPLPVGRFPGLRPAGPAVLQRRPQVLKRLSLPDIEQAGLKTVFVAEVGHRDLVDQVPPQDGGLLVRR